MCLWNEKKPIISEETLFLFLKTGWQREDGSLNTVKKLGGLQINILLIENILILKGLNRNKSMTTIPGLFSPI